MLKATANECQSPEVPSHLTQDDLSGSASRTTSRGYWCHGPGLKAETWKAPEHQSRAWVGPHRAEQKGASKVGMAKPLIEEGGICQDTWHWHKSGTCPGWCQSNPRKPESGTQRRGNSSDKPAKEKGRRERKAARGPA